MPIPHTEDRSLDLNFPRGTFGYVGPMCSHFRQWPQRRTFTKS